MSGVRDKRVTMERDEGRKMEGRGILGRSRALTS